MAEFLMRIVFGLALGIVIGMPAAGIAFVYQLATRHSLSDSARTAGRVVIGIMDRVLEQV